MMNAKRRSGLALAVMLTGLLATALTAAPQPSTQSAFLYGVDSYCNQSSENGTETSWTKVYKNQNTGVLTLIAKGKVINECGCLVCLQNLGTPIYDPQTQETFIATSDKEIVLCPKRCRCKCSSCSNSAAAVLIACYDPSLAPYYDDQSP